MGRYATGVRVMRLGDENRVVTSPARTRRHLELEEVEQPRSGTSAAEAEEQRIVSDDVPTTKMTRRETDPTTKI